MQLNKTKKNLLFGFLSALCLTTVILGVSFITTTMNLGSSGLLPPFDWDFVSPVKLSTQLSSRSEFLYAMGVSVCRALEDGGCICDIPYFNYSVDDLAIWFNMEGMNWLLTYTAVGNNTPYEHFYVVNPIILADLPTALSSDVKTLENITDITENYYEVKRNLVKENMTEYRIYHYYQDGSIINIDSFDSLVFIRYNRFTSYDSGYTHWGGYIDNDFQERRYLGYIDEQFANYTVAINELLDQFFQFNL